MEAHVLHRIFRLGGPSLSSHGMCVHQERQLQYVPEKFVQPRRRSAARVRELSGSVVHHEGERILPDQALQAERGAFCRGAKFRPGAAQGVHLDSSLWARRQGQLADHRARSGRPAGVQHQEYVLQRAFVPRDGRLRRVDFPLETQQSFL